MEPDIHGIQRNWNPAIMGFITQELGANGTRHAWNLASVEPGKRVTQRNWNPVSMEPGKHGTRQAWNPTYERPVYKNR